MMRHTRYIMAAPGVDPLDPVADPPRKHISLPVIFFVILIIGSVAWALIGALNSNSATAHAQNAATITPTPTKTLPPTITSWPTPTPMFGGSSGDPCALRITPIYATVIVPQYVDRIKISTQIVYVPVVQTRLATHDVTRQVTRLITTTQQPTLSPTPYSSQTPWVILITQVVTATHTHTPTATFTPSPTIPVATATATQTPTATITPTP